ncbi:peptidase inhibitor family I36 protein [Saccharopolyspora erythraea]|uniref:peptidase inhibitor family I36 protein n=1 Tax=Saccharopolyspora erythraea TaxID=1836 RepID=UPI001BAA0C5B|nr:peptidase inhibitor family I36 protein [Saccharopolyspora erythraea]QUH01926.1 peptidase inhibitor family I36 protein [Saccharopolyspora erythraea]
MKRRTISLLGMAALTGAAMAGFAPVAAAADDAAEAQAGKFWVYQHDDYKGGWYGFSNTDWTFTNNYWTNAGNSVNDGASSMKNETSREVVMYEHKGYAGRTYYAKPYSVDSDLTNNGFDNMASSLRFR